MLLSYGCRRQHVTKSRRLQLSSSQFFVYILNWTVQFFVFSLIVSTVCRKYNTAECFFFSSFHLSRRHLVYLLWEESWLRRPARPACSRTETAVAAESGVCRVFDTTPVAENEMCKNTIFNHHFHTLLFFLRVTGSASKTTKASLKQLISGHEIKMMTTEKKKKARSNLQQEIPFATKRACHRTETEVSKQRDSNGGRASPPPQTYCACL